MGEEKGKKDSLRKRVEEERWRDSWRRRGGEIAREGEEEIKLEEERERDSLRRRGRQIA